MIMQLLKNVKLYILLVFCFVAYSVSAQTAVEASLDTNALVIGDQTFWRLLLEVDDGTDVLFPVYTDTLVDKVEMLEAHAPDTLSDDDGKLKIEKRYLITSFDSGAYFLPPAPVIVNMKDTLFADRLFLGVNTVSVDTAQAIKDIRMPYDVPFALSPMAKKILLISAVVLLLAVAGYFLYRYYKRVKTGDAEEPESLVDPREFALGKLYDLQHQQLWKQQKHKEHQSLLTDTVREYIEYVYDVPALEMISDEIIEAMRQRNLNIKQLTVLRELLSLADFTKFAKYVPLDAEHEKAIESAIAFVEETSVSVNSESEEQ